MHKLDCLTPRPDHCDLILDAMDQQLDQLQVMSPKPKSDVVPSLKDSPTRTFTNKSAKAFTTSDQNTPTQWNDSVNQKETKTCPDLILRGKEETESRPDQLIRRLEKLLGEACRDRWITGKALPLSESICTEDLQTCSKEETVDLSPFEIMTQLETEDKTERTEISDSDTYQSNHTWQTPEKRGPETSEVMMADCFHSYISGTSKNERMFLVDICGENMSQANETTGFGEKNKTQQRPGDCSSEVASWSFDNLSTDSDLERDSTEVRQQVRWTGRCSFMKDVDALIYSCVEHGDDDTPAEEESEAQLAAGWRLTEQCTQKKRLSGSSNGRKTISDNKDSNQDIKSCIGTSTPVKTSERQLSDFTNMKEEVFDLRHKCEKEEKKLRLKWIQLKEVELCLSELRQKKKQAIQQLEQLSADMTLMQKEKTTLEFAVRGSRYQLQQLQRWTESCLENGFCPNRSYVKMSVLERQEMDRQLECVKAELLAERRRSREKMESLHEQLEAVHEEPHRSTEAGSSALNRCACQPKQMEKKYQTEQMFLDVQVSQLEIDLGECRVKVGMLDKMLAQKEMQLMSLQEERDSLWTERDNLKRELQHLKRQHCRELEEAKEKAQALMEHIEELCSLRCVHWTEGGASASLCSQLKAKERELEQHQMSMAQSKQQTEARLADRLTEQLTADLERKASEIKDVIPDESNMHGAKESQEAVCSHLHHEVVCAAAHAPSDLSSLKLLCNPQSEQSEVAENQAFPDSLNFVVLPSSLTTVRGNFPKKHFEEI